MDFNLTLVASDKSLSAGHIATVEGVLNKQAILITGEPSWLNPHKAADLPIAEYLTIEQIQELRTLLSDSKIDIFCTRTAGRRKKLLIADMDATIVTTETLDELADEAGIKDKIAAITERAMRGELNFFDALKERVGLLKGLSTNALKRTLDETEISIGANIAVQTMKKHNAFCVLVSGGFTYFTENIAAKVGFNAHHGNILDIDNNALTGKVIEPILDKETKLQFLKKYTQKQQIGLCDTVAIGDGANDLPMLEAAGLGIGYRPKPLLEERLLNCIRFTDLSSILYIQGYKKEEFVK